MSKSRPNIVIVTRKTRLEGLKKRHVSAGMIQFRLVQAHAIELGRRRNRGGDAGIAALEEAQEAGAYEEYQAEHQAYHDTLAYIRRELDVGLPLRPLDRALVPRFDFWNTAAVVVVGQDGLVANTAKYVGDLPLVGVNPDPDRFDGVLLPFRPDEARAAVQRVLASRFPSQQVTLAEVNLNDGQRMLAFNDFFIGCATHVSARYTLEVGGRSEPQSSSGVLVSTGAGSTGWLSSVFNMAEGVGRLAGGKLKSRPALKRTDRCLLWAVREPFVSRQSGASLVAGTLDEGQELVLESLMPERGVIFSDGIESDFLEFNSGAIARVTVSAQSARLVQKI